MGKINKKKTVNFKFSISSCKKDYVKTSYFTGVIASLLLNSITAKAGVVFEKNPKLKNYSEDASITVGKPKYKDNTKNISKVGVATNYESGQKTQSDNIRLEELSLQSLVLPGTLASIVGLALVGFTFDSDFASFMNKSSLRPSDVYGAGYEPILKDGSTPRQIDTQQTPNNK